MRLKICLAMAAWIFISQSLYAFALKNSIQTTHTTRFNAKDAINTTCLKKLAKATAFQIRKIASNGCTGIGALQ